jgi:hypothetical protein
MKNKTSLLLKSMCILFCSTAIQAQNIEDKVNKYLENAQQIYRLDEEGRNFIWEAYCRKYDLTLQEDKQYANQVADNWQQKEKAQFNSLITDGNNLINDLQNLSNDPQYKDKVSGWMDKVKKEKNIIEQLDNGVVLKGANHPFVQYATEYGKKQHEDLCGHYSSPKVCDKDFGSGIRPDLVYIDPSNGLYVLEFKPDNSEAKSKGEHQLDNYVPMIKSFYEKCFPSGRTGEPSSLSSDFGGSDFLQKLKFCDSAWESDNMHLKIHREVVTYGPCDKKF